MKSREKSFLVVLLSVYALGACTSQALMSFAATLMLIYFFFLFAKNFASWTRAPWTADKFFLILSLVYVVVLILGLVLRQNFEHAIFRSREIPLFLIPSLSCLVTFRKKLRLVLNDFKVPASFAFLGVVISLGVLIYQTLILHHEGSGLMRSSIYTSYNLLPAFFFALILWQSRGQSDRFWNRLSLLLVLTSFVGVLLTGSRGATLAAFAILCGTLIVKILKSKKHRRSLVVGSTTAVLAFTALAVHQYQSNPSFRSRYENVLHPMDINSVKYRMQIWDYNFSLFRKNPIFGVGYKNNGMVEKRLTDEGDRYIKYRRKLKGFHAHNIFIQALAESGIVGLALFLGYLFLPVFIDRSMLIFAVGIGLSGLNEATFYNSRVANSVFCFTLLSLLILKSDKSVKASRRS